MGVGLANARIERSDLDELHSLAESAGFDPIERMLCRRARPDAALFMGSGKADEIGRWLKEHPVDVVLFDNDLGPVQSRNLQARWDVPVLDRTELILEIFSRRAHSREGKLQVELARLEHLSARLVRGWSHLERQRGGIGGRGGPGEKQVELDRRMLDVRVRRLRGELEQIRRQRSNRRRARERSRIFRVSIVGYTNAGKSTLFNRLTQADTLAADQLFATLDTLSRRVRLPDGGHIMLSDTVGFVRDLPHALVDAFKATLEETAQADLLLHVIDAASPNRREQREAVERVLHEIGAQRIPVIEVYNKIDLLPDARAWDTPSTSTDDANGAGPCDSMNRVSVSAASDLNIASLLALVGSHRAASESASGDGAAHFQAHPSARSVDPVVISADGSANGTL